MAALACLPQLPRHLVVPPAAFAVATSEDHEISLLRALEPTHDPDYGRLPRRAKDKFLCKLGAMVMLDRSANKTTAAASLESQLGMQMGRGFSATRLLNDYYAWIGASKNWRLLVDAALAPGFRRVKKSQGILSPKLGDGCQVPPETADWWVQLAEEHQRNSAVAWREAQRQWELSWADDSVVIPGYGNARQYWARTKPSLLSLPTCPPDLPRGWSRSTFYAKMPPEWETANARIGSAYARGLLPGVPTTRKGARYLEWVFFDDKWHELYVVVDGVLTPCRLLELGVLDYATGEYIVWGFRPELPANDDQGRLRLKEQDMKWLVAALFQQEGYPRDYDCHLICERGTAVLREGPARALFDLSGGRIKTIYTEMQGSTRLIWDEKKKGNSKGKAPLESFHSYTKNESGRLPGQTGVDHERQPSTLPAQLRETRALLELGALMPPEENEKLKHSLLRYDEAVIALERIYRRANERTEHRLEGVEKDVVGWRLSEGQPFTWTRTLPAEVQALSRVPGFEVTTRKPSPLEMKARLKDGEVFVPIPDWAWPLFFDHTQVVKVIQGLEISFDRGGKEYIFWPDDQDPGALTLARDIERKGEKLLGYFNDRNPERLYLTRQDGGYFGTWNRVQRASRAEREAHSLLRERVERRASFARRNSKRRHGEEESEQLARTFENGAALEKAGVLPPAGAVQAPGADLARVIADDDRKRAAKKAAQAIKPTLSEKDFLPRTPKAPTHPGFNDEAPAAENDEGLWMYEPEPSDSDSLTD